MKWRKYLSSIYLLARKGPGILFKGDAKTFHTQWARKQNKNTRHAFSMVTSIGMMAIAMNEDSKGWNSECNREIFLPVCVRTNKDMGKRGEASNIRSSSRNIKRVLNRQSCGLFWSLVDCAAQSRRWNLSFSAWEFIQLPNTLGFAGVQSCTSKLEVCGSIYLSWQRLCSGIGDKANFSMHKGIINTD